MDIDQAMRHPAYWILLVAAAVWALIGTGLVFHLEAVFQTSGMGVVESTRAMTCLAIGMGAMQLMGGLMADRLAMRWLLVAAMGLMAVSCMMLALGQGSTLIVAYGVYGIAQGLKSIVATTAWARFYGRKHLGKIRGTSLTATIAGSSVGPLLMGLSADYLGSFTQSIWLFVAMAAALSIAALWATPPKLETQPG
jgi:MFS family permease